MKKLKMCGVITMGQEAAVGPSKTGIEMSDDEVEGNFAESSKRFEIVGGFERRFRY